MVAEVIYHSEIEFMLQFLVDLCQAIFAKTNDLRNLRIVDYTVLLSE